MLLQSTSFEHGGAAIAAKRWVEALEFEGNQCQSAMLRHSYRQRFANKVAESLFWNKTLFAYRGPISIGLVGREKSRNSEAYFTHWVQNGFLSLFQLSLQSKKTIWYLHDEWLLIGTGHYGDFSRLESRLPRRTWLLDFVLRKWKLKFLIQPALGICVPSNWMKGRLIDNGVSADRILVIPNPIPDVFLNSPSKATARLRLNLEVNEKIVLVVASSTILDKRKGVDLIEPTLSQLLKQDSGILLITVGIDNFDLRINGMNHKPWKRVDSELELVDLYAAADVLFIPSRLDNLPQVVTEAQSVGLPVVAFDVGGISDAILVLGVSGKVVEDFSLEKAAESIQFFLENSKEADRGDWVSKASKQWSGPIVKELFCDFIDNLDCRSATTP